MMQAASNRVFASFLVAVIISCLQVYKSILFIPEDENKTVLSKNHSRKEGAGKQSKASYEATKRRKGAGRRHSAKQNPFVTTTAQPTAESKTKQIASFGKGDVGETIDNLGVEFAKNRQQTADAPKNHTRLVPRPCDCVQATCTRCHRGVIQVHKMGVTLMNTVMWKYFPGQYHIAEIVDHNKLGSKLLEFTKVEANPEQFDYRHILVTRNFDDSLLSGYLYHRAHMECERDWFGKPGFQGWLLNNTDENWEKRILEHAHEARREQYPWPPGKGRDLCTYLSEESERDGLRVYIEWAKHAYLEPLLGFVRHRRTAESPHNRKTLFICYEDLLSNYTGTVQKMGQWFVPGSAPKNVTPNDGVTDRDKRDDSGAHATERNPVVRSRLKAAIRELDETVFGGSVAKGNAELDC